MSNSGPEEQIDQRDLTAVVRNSKALLEYAALAGIQLPEPTINALVRAKDWSKTNPASLDETVKFYAALTELAGKAAPVTVDTLRMPEDKARRSLRRNGFFSVALALVVVIFSGVTYVTVSMSKDIENGIEHANDLAVKLRSQVGPPNPGNIQETTCGVATEPPKPELSSKDEILIISELQDFSSTIRTILRTSMKLDFFVRNWETSPLDTLDGTSEWKQNPQAELQLQPGLVNMRKEAFCKIGAYQDVREFGLNVRADILAVYGAFSNYLLPVLYALLGAFAFNLRDFSDRVTKRTYHASSYANTARTVAAMTVGVISVCSEHLQPGCPAQPLALACLEQDYGVEVLNSLHFSPHYSSRSAAETAVRALRRDRSGTVERRAPRNESSNFCVLGIALLKRAKNCGRFDCFLAAQIKFASPMVASTTVETSLYPRQGRVAATYPNRTAAPSVRFGSGSRSAIAASIATRNTSPITSSPGFNANAPNSGSSADRANADGASFSRPPDTCAPAFSISRTGSSKSTGSIVRTSTQCACFAAPSIAPARGLNQGNRVNEFETNC